MNKPNYERKRKEKNRMRKYNLRSVKITEKRKKLEMFELAQKKNINIPFVK